MNIINTISYINDYFNNKLYLDDDTLLNYITYYDNIIDILIDTKPLEIEYIKENVIIDYNIYHSSIFLKRVKCKKFKINYDDKINKLSIHSINKFNNISDIVSIEIINLNDLKIFYKILNNNINTLTSITLTCCRFDSSSISLSFKNILLLIKLYKNNFPLKFNYTDDLSFSLNNLQNLRDISFEYCNDYTFKLFEFQEKIKKISVKSDISTFKGFSHKYFDKILQSNKIKHVTMLGMGTGEYFTFNNLTFDIETLNTSYLTYNYNDKNNRKKYFEVKYGYLKNLTIHHFPFDFDGGNILKYIIEEMNLISFNYRNISLIKNKIKQPVYEFESSEHHITSIYEMCKQFNTITKITLNLNKSDVSRDRILMEICNNSNLNIFNNLTTLIVNDNSENVYLLKIFVSFIKQMKNIKKIVINTQDPEINNLLIFLDLKNLKDLEDVTLISSVSNYIHRLNTIKNNVPNLKKLTINAKYIYESKKIFNDSIDIIPYNFD